MPGEAMPQVGRTTLNSYEAVPLLEVSAQRWTCCAAAATFCAIALRFFKSDLSRFQRPLRV
jgi:hypothetical protein